MSLDNKTNNLIPCQMGVDDSESIKVALPEFILIEGKKEFALDLKKIFIKEYPILLIYSNNKDSQVIYKKGNLYPNSALGDLQHCLNKGLNIIKIEDISRFENEKQQIKIQTNDNFHGFIGYYIG